ncbi:MAG: hypothetical protein ACPG7U_02835 [Holosporaceae bacterium]
MKKILTVALALCAVASATLDAVTTHDDVLKFMQDIRKVTSPADVLRYGIADRYNGLFKDLHALDESDAKMMMHNLLEINQGVLALKRMSPSALAEAKMPDEVKMTIAGESAPKVLRVWAQLHSAMAEKLSAAEAEAERLRLGQAQLDSQNKDLQERLDRLQKQHAALQNKVKTASGKSEKE